MDENWMARCEAEPPAYSGAIQPHGGLLCLDAQWCVSHVSAQIEEFVPQRIVAGHALPDELACALYIVSLKKQLSSTNERFHMNRCNS